MTRTEYHENFNKFIEINNIKEGDRLKLIKKYENDDLMYNTTGITNSYSPNINSYVVVKTVNYGMILIDSTLFNYTVGDYYSYDCFTGSLDTLLIPNEHIVPTVLTNEDYKINFRKFVEINNLVVGESIVKVIKKRPENYQPYAFSQFNDPIGVKGIITQIALYGGWIEFALDEESKLLMNDSLSGYLPYDCFTGDLCNLLIPVNNNSIQITNTKLKQPISNRRKNINTFKINKVNNQLLLGNMIFKANKPMKVRDGILCNHIKFVEVT